MSTSKKINPYPTAWKDEIERREQEAAKLKALEDEAKALLLAEEEAKKADALAKKEAKKQAARDFAIAKKKAEEEKALILVNFIQFEFDDCVDS